MFGMGWSELLVIGIVALIVVGPKDLPVLFRQVGQFVGKAKGMAREFSQAMNDAADESGMRDVSSNLTKSLKAATNPLGSAMDGVKSAAKSLTDIDPNSETGKLAVQREADIKRIQASTARAAAERKQREATEAMAQAEAAESKLAPQPAAAAAKASAPKSVTAAKAPPKKPAAKKPAVTKVAAAKAPAAKKAPAKAKPAKKST